MTALPATHHATKVRDSLSRNITVDIASRFGYLLTRFLVPPFILAHVTLEAYGLWSAAFIVVSYLGISTMGISNVYVKYVAEFAAKKDYHRANQLLSTGLFVTVPICIAAFAAIVIFWNALAAWLHISLSLRSDAHEVVLSVVAIFLASISLSAFRDMLVATHHTLWVQVIWVITYCIETALIYLLIAGGRGIRGLAEAFVIRTILEIALSIAGAFRLSPWLAISPSLVSRESLHILFTFGSITQIQSLLAVFLNSVERVIAAPLAGLAATGLLEIAKKMPAMAASIPLAFASSLLPAASYLQGGAGSPETIQKLYLKGGRYMHLSSGMMFALMAVIPGPILSVWFGKHYPGAAYLMTIFCIAGQFNLLTGAGSSIFRGIGKVHEEFFFSLPNLAFLGLLLPLSRLLLEQWSTTGIGTAVAASTCLAAVVFLVRANRLIHIPFPVYWKAVLTPGLIPYAVAIPLGIPVHLIVSHVSRLNGALCIAVAGILYASLTLAFVFRFAFQPGEQLWFKAMASKTVARVLGNTRETGTS